MSIAITAAAPSPPVHNPRTQALLHGPIVPTLLRLAWPNVLVMLAQASTGLIETWFVVASRHRRARGHGAGVSRLHDDADAVGRRDGRRHFVGHRACSWRHAGARMRTRWFCMR